MELCARARAQSSRTPQIGRKLCSYHCQASSRARGPYNGAKVAWVTDAVAHHHERKPASSRKADEVGLPARRPARNARTCARVAARHSIDMVGYEI